MGRGQGSDSQHLAVSRTAHTLGASSRVPSGLSSDLFVDAETGKQRLYDLQNQSPLALIQALTDANKQFSEAFAYLDCGEFRRVYDGGSVVYKVPRTVVILTPGEDQSISQLEADYALDNIVSNLVEGAPHKFGYDKVPGIAQTQLLWLANGVPVIEMEKVIAIDFHDLLQQPEGEAWKNLPQIDYQVGKTPQGQLVAYDLGSLLRTKRSAVWQAYSVNQPQ